MGSFGGYAYAGGTCYFGGGTDAEERWYNLLQRWLGEGAYDKDSATVRSRMLQSFACALAFMENEAKKGAVESVPSLSIDQIEEWELIFGLDLVRGIYGDTALRQRFMRACQEMLCNSANIIRVRELVIYILQDDGVSAWENDGSTIISDDGVRYWCVMIPYYYAYPEYRPLYRALKLVLQKWAPAHTIVTLATTTGDGTYGITSVPGFFTDGGPVAGIVCACDKDCPRP